MSIMTELRDMALKLSARFPVPKIAGIVFPPFFPGGQPKECEFMAMTLEGGAGGISYVLIPDNRGADYRALMPDNFIGTRPERYVETFGESDPIGAMLGLAAINAICQQVMRLTGNTPGSATDSLGLMQIRAGDRVGMVGFFPPLLKYLRNTDTELTIIERNPQLIERYPTLPVTLDVTALNRCNKVLCTGTTVQNGTIEEVLLHCRTAEHISVLGPTAGYFPDPLFACGVHVMGGRLVNDGLLLLELIAQRKPWGAATRKLCFEACQYDGLPGKS
ncbi:MAG TPA: hypothetical protein HPP97_09370 [Desulfuromonadales bacterium]|nr:hypothetical protein [Desulfuromonadales bacterium]